MAGIVRNLEINMEYPNDDWSLNPDIHLTWNEVENAQGYEVSVLYQFEMYNKDNYYVAYTEYTTNAYYSFYDHVGGVGMLGFEVRAIPDGLPTRYFFSGGYVYPESQEQVGDIKNMQGWYDILDACLNYWTPVPEANGYEVTMIKFHNLDDITDYASITPDKYYAFLSPYTVDTEFFFLRGYEPADLYDGFMVRALPNGRPSFYIFELGMFYPFETTGEVTGLRADVYYDPFANVRLSWDHVENAEGYKYIIRKPMYEFYAASTTIQSSGTIVTGETSENMVTIEDFGLRFGVGYFECEVYALPDGESSYESFYVDQVVGKPQKWEWYTPKISEETFNLTAVEWNDFCARINHYGYYYDFPWRSPFEYQMTTSATAASSGYNGYYQPYPFTIVKKSDRVMASYINEAIAALGIIYDRGSYHGGVITVTSVSAFALTTDIGTMDRQITGSPPPLPDFVNEGDIIYAELFIQLRDCLNAIGVYVDAPK